MNIPSIVALLIVLLLMSLGDVFSKLTKGYFPPVFFIAVLFLLFFWSGFKSDIFTMASFTKESFTIAMAFMIADHATSLSIYKIMKYKRYLLFSFSTLLIFVSIALLAARFLSVDDYIYASIPSLSGGFYASVMMQQHFQEDGFINLSFLCIIIYSIQGFFRFPSLNFLVKI